MTTQAEQNLQLWTHASSVANLSQQDIDRLVSDGALTMNDFREAVEISKLSPSQVQQNLNIDEILGQYSPKAIPELTLVEKLQTELKSTEMSDVGQLVGSIGGAFLPTPIDKFAKGKFIAEAVTDAVKTAIGSAAGYETERGLKNYLNDADLNFEAKKVLSEAGTEGFYNLIGDFMFKSASNLGKLFLRTKPENQPELEDLQKLLTQKGTTLALDQYSDKAIIQFFGSVLRGYPFTKNAFENLSEKQDEAVLKYYDDLANEFAGRASNELSSIGFNRLLRMSITDTKAAHKAQTRALYDELDEAVNRIPEVFEETRVSPILDAKGLPITSTGKRVRMVKPVDISTFRTMAGDLLRQIEKISPASVTEEGISILKKYSQGDKRLTIGETAQLIQDLNRVFTAKEGKKITTQLGPMKEELKRAFNVAADKLPDDYARVLRRANVFYAFGAPRYNNKFIESLLSGDPSEVGLKLLKMNPEDMVRLKKIVGMQGWDKINPDTTISWPRIQAGMLEGLLPKNLKQLDTAAINGRKKDSRIDNILKATFDKNDLATINRGLDALEKLQTPAQRALLGQSRVIASGIVGTGGAAYAFSGGDTTVADFIISMYAAPKALAYALTNKRFVTALSALEFNTNTKGRRAGNSLVKITRLWNEITSDPTASLKEEQPTSTNPSPVNTEESPSEGLFSPM